MTYGMIQPALWAVSGIAAVALAALALWTWHKGKKPRRPLLASAVAAAFALLVVPAIGIVPAGYRGVVYEWGGGVNPKERGEGITLLVPWIQTMRTISVRTQKVFSSKVLSQSSDLQEITVVASVNYHVRPDRAAELYQTVGPQYRQTVIQPAFYRASKAAVGEVRAEDFALNRDPLALKIEERLTKQLSSYGLVVEYVNIEDAIFQKRFMIAVQAKIVAEQVAKEQENLIAAKAAVKVQTIIEAEAKARAIKIEADQQARANRVIARSLTADLLRWRWIVTWNGSLPSTLVGGKDVTLLIGGFGGSSSYGY